MSSDFEKVLVRDKRLDVTDKIHYAVHKGGKCLASVITQVIGK